jgi:hypothetical protein
VSSECHAAGSPGSQQLGGARLVAEQPRDDDADGPGSRRGGIVDVGADLGFADAGSQFTGADATRIAYAGSHRSPPSARQRLYEAALALHSDGIAQEVSAGAVGRLA